ncbi:hypothetical protein FJT64_022171 [Amphibalanus amphitrite]|uniref:SEA domain-containing protein n=1 Tax=Amphibalanus amphitrite TaxID=1232801 RepID=A0A6A4WFQ2_AMPAM|nr:hypothetical protein FJT64_022171 [Amphibalanus amphitrite]
MRRVLPLLLPLLLLSGQTVTFVNAEVTTEGTTVVTNSDGDRTTYNSTGNDTITTSATSETDGWTQSGLDVENTTTAVDLNATTTTTAETSTSTTPSTTTRRTTRTTTTTTTTTTTPPPPNWNLLPVERCLCRLDRSLSWAREQLIAEILLAEEAARAAATTTLSPNETQSVTVAGVWGSIRILNMHWRTVLLYPEEVAYQEATKYIHEQLDRIFRQALGSWYSTSEVLHMEEGSVIAHHKVYLTREVENMTELVRASFEAGYESGISDIRVDNSTSYYIPPGPAPKPAIWYLRYLALAIGIVIVIAIMYDIAWRTNTCALRSPYGYLEEPDGKQHVTLRERLRVAADKTRAAAGRTFVATRDVAVKTGRTISNPETFRKIGTLVTTNVVWVKTVGALKKSPQEDRQPTLDPEQGMEQQAEQLEQQLDEQLEQQLDEPGQTDGGDVQEPEEGESPAEGEGEGEAADKGEGEAPAEEGTEEATPSDEPEGGSPEAEEGAPKEEEQEPAKSTENEQPSEDAPTEPVQQEADG